MDITSFPNRECGIATYCQDLLKSIEESVLVAQVQEISLPLIAEIKSQIIPLKDSIVVVASSAIAKPMKALNSADATVAMLFILAVGSPLLQVLHQYITSAKTFKTSALSFICSFELFL